LRQEGWRIDTTRFDASEFKKIAEFEHEYGYLLHYNGSPLVSPSSESLLADAIPLDPNDSQLAEVACLLGFTLYLRAHSPRYLVLSQDGQIVVTGDRLTVTLVDLIRSIQPASSY